MPIQIYVILKAVYPNFFEFGRAGGLGHPAGRGKVSILLKS